MHIICATHGDGTNPNFLRLVKSLAKKFNIVKVVAWDRLAQFGDIQSKEGIDFEFIMKGWGFKNSKLLFGLPIWMLRLIVHSIKIKPDVFWASNFETALPIAIATRITRIPYIYYIHDNITLAYAFPSLLQSILELCDNFIISKSSVVIVPDENRILPHAEAFRDKFHVLPNTPSSDIAPTLIKPTNDNLTICFSGSVWVSRGIESLLEASIRFEKCIVLIAGTVHHQKILRIIQSHPRVDFRGHLPHRDALELYNESHVVFAFYDPQLLINVRASPTKLYESMMMATPVLVNSETMISLKVEEWGIGYTCNYDDVDQLEELLHQIYENLAETYDMGQKARKIYDERFDWKHLEPDLWRLVDITVHN